MGKPPKGSSKRAGRKTQPIACGSTGFVVISSCPAKVSTAMKELMKLVHTANGIDIKSITERAIVHVETDCLETSLRQELSSNEKYPYSTHEIVRSVGFVRLDPEIYSGSPSLMLARVFERAGDMFVPSYITRVIPIDITAPPNLQGLEQSENTFFKSLENNERLSQHFENVSYQVIMNRRNNSLGDRDELINGFNQRIRSVDNRNRIDYKAADTTLFVEVNLYFTGIGFGIQYYDYAKYNVRLNGENCRQSTKSEIPTLKCEPPITD